MEFVSCRFRIVILILIALSLTGCWDHIEIEERSYVLGIAIDKHEPLPIGYEEEVDYQGERDLERMPLQIGPPKYAYAIQVPIVNRAKNMPEGTSGGGGDGERAWDLVIAGNSFTEAERQFATRMGLQPFYAHLQAIIISAEVAREGIVDIIDIFLRNPEIRRRTRIFISPGEAKRILDVTPKVEDYSSLYLIELPLNARVTSRLLHKTDLGEVSESLHGDIDFVLPRVISTKDEIKNAGAAVFKEGKMVGWLGEIDSIYLKWIRDAVLGGVIQIRDPVVEGSIVSLDVKRTRTSVRPVIDGDRIKMSIKSDGVFVLNEQFQSHFEDSFKEDYIKKLQIAVQNSLKEGMEDTIRYVQREYGADIFHFSLAMQRYRPHEWDRVKENWRDIFPDVEVDIEVKVRIEQTGNIR